MAKFVDYAGGREVQDIMEKFLEKFPQIFEGFDTSRIGFVMTKKKKAKIPIRLVTVGYPLDVFTNKTYVIETFQAWWEKMDQKKRNLAVFHIMCAVPEGAFDEESKAYGKKLQPEIKMYMKEYAASGGIPNWMENPAAIDPLDRTLQEIADDVPETEADAASEEDDVERSPITKEAVEAVA